MKRLVVLVLVLALAGMSGAAAGVCGGPGTSRSHCCCHPDDAGDAVGTQCQCRIAPQPEGRSDSLPPSVSGPDRIDAGALSSPAPVAHVYVAASSFGAPAFAPTPPASPPSYVTTHSFRC